MFAHPTYPIPLRSPPTIWKRTSLTGPLYGTRPSIPSGTSFFADISPSWKYLSALPSCIAARLPMPRIILKRRPSSSSDSPGLSSVPASSIPKVRCANRGSDAQSGVLILVGIRKIAPLVDVLYRDQSTQRTLLVDHRQLLDAMLSEYRLGFVECSPDGGGDEILRGHR